jgi:hypothetical protein
MRLVNTRTLQLEEFVEHSTPPYAILSHTWGPQELLFADMADLERARATKPAGVAKLEGLCKLAREQCLDYAWNDTCCIDKSSSAELSEAINSMYRWYANSRVCYAYLWDVHDCDKHGKPYQRSQVLDQVVASRWFTRGWTLQELIAPERVEFYTKTWTYLGEKGDDDLLPILSEASLVDECVLARVVSLKDIIVAKKMYWASKRVTTRKEDIAYCLLGLFGVNMPLLYGEGKKAFIRFIIDQDDAWMGGRGAANIALANGVLASSPQCFALSGDIWPLDPLSSGIPPENIGSPNNRNNRGALGRPQNRHVPGESGERGCPTLPVGIQAGRPSDPGYETAGRNGGRGLRAGAGLWEGDHHTQDEK